MDYKDIIIAELSVLVQKETIAGNVFKVRAYQKVIKQLKAKTCIMNDDDLEDVKGIGKRIKEKINEVFKTGKLKSADRARKEGNLETYEELLKVHGIGVKKAKELVETFNVVSVEDLKEKVGEDKSILNEKQKIGLKYYADLNLRIPRKEMDSHNKFLQETLKEINAEIVIVGSYRRGAKESGDIDLLVCPNEESETTLSEITSTLIKHGYIKSTLAEGVKKFMGVVKLKYKHHFRRLDILITSKEEFPYAKLYFTGSADCNIILRQEAIDRGYRLNEYALTENGVKIIVKSEKDIFEKLGYKYIQPENRTRDIEKFRLTKMK